MRASTVRIQPQLLFINSGRIVGFFFGVWARKGKKEIGAAGAVSAVGRRRAPQGALGHRRRAL